MTILNLRGQRWHKGFSKQRSEYTMLLHVLLIFCDTRINEIDAINQGYLMPFHRLKTYTLNPCTDQRLSLHRSRLTCRVAFSCSRCMMILLSSILSCPSPSFSACILRRASLSPASSERSLLISTSVNIKVTNEHEHTKPEQLKTS